MIKCISFLALLAPAFLFSQNHNYWIKFKDKNNNSFSLSNPQQFLSERSVERRVKQNITLNISDLPLTQDYVDSVSPFITNIIHRLKWFNLLVAKIDDPGMVVPNIDAKADTTIGTDTFSITIRDTVITHYRILVSLAGSSYDTISLTYSDTLNDTVFHFGPIVIRDSIFITDNQMGNKFDSIRQFAFVDSIAEIADIPRATGKMHNKFEEVEPVNQRIIYPNRYGAAYHQINMLNADLLHQMGYRGNGIIISMMDNGFYNVPDIRAFDSVRNRIIATYDFVNHEEDVYNDGSHGENTFSCIAANIPDGYLGTAPDANFYLLTTEDNSAEWIMEEYNWVAGAEFADSAGAQIFSTSLGYTQFDGGAGNHTYSDLNGDKTVITQAGNIAASKGILVFNSAGNEGNSSWRYISAPADGINVIAVGAVDSVGQVAPFSGRGPNSSDTIIKPDLCAQGVNTAVINANGSIGTSGGTSFSCPILAGCAASLWSAFPDKSAKEIWVAIVTSADHFWSPDNNHGYGIPNFYNAYLNLKTNYNGNILRISDNAAVFPNPFGSELNVSLFNSESKNRQIEIFDVLGRKVYSTEIFLRDNTFEIVKLDGVKTLLAGEYILKLDGDKNKTHRIVKVK